MYVLVEKYNKPLELLYLKMKNRVDGKRKEQSRESLIRMREWYAGALNLELPTDISKTKMIFFRYIFSLSM